MALKQTELPEPDRGGSETSGTCRVVLTGGERAGFAGPASDLADVIQGRDSRFNETLDDWDRARGMVDDIVDNGSPALTGSGRPDVDRYGWCFGDGSVGDAISIADGFDEVEIVLSSLTGFGETARAVADQLDPLAEISSRVCVRIRGEWVWVDDFAEFLAGLRAADSMGIELQREARKDDHRRWADWAIDGGRAPLGFEWSNGELVPAENYRDVCACLEMVRDGEMSKRKAAAHLNTSPRTITRSIEERGDRYGL